MLPKSTCARPLSPRRKQSYSIHSGQERDIARTPNSVCLWKWKKKTESEYDKTSCGFVFCSRSQNRFKDTVYWLPHEARNCSITDRIRKMPTGRADRGVSQKLPTQQGNIPQGSSLVEDCSTPFECQMVFSLVLRLERFTLMRCRISFLIQ